MATAIIQQAGKIQSLKICFIENEEEQRKEIREDLREFGNKGNWTVVDYSDVICSRAINNEFDIVVCDFKMPVKNGIKVLEEIRAKNKRVILALYTAFAISEHSEEAQRCDKAFIRRFKKFDGMGCLLGTLDNQVVSLRTQLKEEEKVPKTRITLLQRIFSPPPKEQKVTLPDYDYLQIETGEVNTDITDIVKLLKSFSEDLLKEMEDPGADEIYIMHSTEGKISLKQLQDHIRNLTPIGIDHIKYWLMAKKRIKSRR